MAHLSWNFFGTNHYCYFHLPIGLFHCAKLKKNSYSWSRVMRMHHFGAQNGPFAPNNFFFWKIINTILIYLLAPFIVENFTKILPEDPELWGCTIFGPKMTHFSKWDFFFFFRKPVNEPCFFDSCLSTCQKSNLLVIYWRLKNTEISLAKSHFWLWRLKNTEISLAKSHFWL